jgi:hypothetical protein
MDMMKTVATVDACLALVQDHRLVAMVRRMKALEGLLTTLRKDLSIAAANSSMGGRPAPDAGLPPIPMGTGSAGEPTL